MGINRRRGNRRVFKFNKNYIIPFFCILITCTTIIVSTCIILNLQKKIPIQSGYNEGVQVVEVQINDNEKKQINEMFSFLMSNVDIGQELSNENVRYLITCKYYAMNNEFQIVDNEYIDNILPDVYRDLGYVYFEDYKDTYMYIDKERFISTYKQLFNTNKLNQNSYSNYYISNLNGFVVPKNNYIYDNSKYKVQNISYDKQNDIYIATLLEINVLKLYEQKEYTEVLQYLESVEIDNNYLTGKMLKVKMKKIDNRFVFYEYTI